MIEFARRSKRRSGSEQSRAVGLELAVSALMFLAGCGSPDAPNLVLISLDTTRADRLSTYGYHRKTSPRLSLFAAEGVRFEHAYSASASTGPSHATLFTSLHPYEHGYMMNGMVLDDERETLAEVLAERGYATHGIAGSFVLDGRFALNQGFESWDADFDKEASSYRRNEFEGHRLEAGFDRPADETTRRATAWLEGGVASRRPFFLFVHYFDPHDPYSPPQRFRPRRVIGSKQKTKDLLNLYDGEIAFLDEQIGKLLDTLDGAGLVDDTLVVIMGDHGEGLMQRGYMNHGLYINEEAVHVPLLMRLPGVIQGGLVFDSPVGAVDVVPTILDLLFDEPSEPAHFRGESLASAIRESREPGMERPVYVTRRRYAPRPDSESRPKGEHHGVRVGRWKYMVAPEEGRLELFDLVADPGELRNLATERPRKAEEMSILLESWRSAQGPSQAVPALDPDVRERLEVLGYVE